MALVPFGKMKARSDVRGVQRKGKMPGKVSGRGSEPGGADGGTTHPVPNIDGERRGHYPGKPYRV